MCRSFPLKKNNLILSQVYSAADVQIVKHLFVLLALPEHTALGIDSLLPSKTLNFN